MFPTPTGLPYAAGHDPAVIVGPLMTTSVDSIGLMLYLVIAQVRTQSLHCRTYLPLRCAWNQPDDVATHRHPSDCTDMC